MCENGFKTPADRLGELEPPRPESEILEECFPQAERIRNAAGFCQLHPDAPARLVEERLYIDLLKAELWLDFGIKDIGRATAEQVAHCSKTIKSDELKYEKP